MTFRDYLNLSARAEEKALRHPVDSDNYERLMVQARDYLERAITG